MSPRWLFFPSAAGNDWDTYAVAINTYTGFTTTGYSGYMQDGTSGATETLVKTDTNYFNAMRSRARTVSGVYGVQLLNNPGSSGPFAAYAALWWIRSGSTTISDWYVVKYEPTASQGGFYSFVESRDGASALPASNNLTAPLAIARYESQPSDISGWTDYA